MQMAYRLKFKHKLKIYQWVLGIIIVLIAALTCYAATNEPSWIEHIDLVTVLISGLFVVISWFVIKTLQKFESNQDLLFNKYNELEKRVSHIEGAHEARMVQKIGC